MDGYSEQGQFKDHQMQFKDEELRDFDRQEQQYGSELGSVRNGDGDVNDMRDSVTLHDSAKGSV